MALAGEPVADDLLGAPDRAEVAAQGVDVGGVEEVDPAFGRGVQDGVALRRVALQAEGHGA